MKKNYIFTNKKHSNRAIMATILGIISMVFMSIVIFMAYRSAGETTVGYGVIGLLSTIFSMVGLILGVITVRDNSYYRIFPVLGIVLNLLVLAGISLILYVGANL